MHSPLKEKFPRDFHVYDLREFLSVLDIIQDSVLDFSDNKCMKISSEDGKQTLQYTESDSQFITSFVDKTPVLPSIDIDVNVSEDQFSRVMKAAHSMKLEFVGFVCDGETISISAFNKNNGDNNVTNKFSIELGEGDTPFQMFYKLKTQNISVLDGEGDLHFEISKKKISKIEAQSGKLFWIALNAESSYDDQ